MKAAGCLRNLEVGAQGELAKASATGRVGLDDGAVCRLVDQTAGSLGALKVLYR